MRSILRTASSRILSLIFGGLIGAFLALSYHAAAGGSAAESPAEAGARRIRYPDHPGRGTASGGEARERARTRMRLVNGETLLIPLDKMELPFGSVAAGEKGEFLAEPRLTSLIGASAEQEDQLNEILRDFQRRQSQFESENFKIVIEDGEKVVIKIENDPGEALRNRSRLDDAVTRVLGREKSSLFMRFARNFLDENPLFTDNVRVVSIVRPSDEIQELAQADYHISTGTLLRTLVGDAEGESVDSHIRSAFANGHGFGGTGWHTSTIPPQLVHLLADRATDDD